MGFFFPWRSGGHQSSELLHVTWAQLESSWADQVYIGSSSPTVCSFEGGVQNLHVGGRHKRCGTGAEAEPKGVHAARRVREDRCGTGQSHGAQEAPGETASRIIIQKGCANNAEQA